MNPRPHDLQLNLLPSKVLVNLQTYGDKRGPQAQDDPTYFCSQETTSNLSDGNAANSRPNDLTLEHLTPKVRIDSRHYDTKDPSPPDVRKRPRSDAESANSRAESISTHPSPHGDTTNQPYNQRLNPFPPKIVINPRSNDNPAYLRPPKVPQSLRPHDVTRNPRSSKFQVNPRLSDHSVNLRLPKVPKNHRPQEVPKKPRPFEDYCLYLDHVLDYRSTIPGARVTARRSGQDEGRIRRLEDEKESLSLQVSVLTEQIDAQTEKIRDMEMCILQYKPSGISQNDRGTGQELLTRSSLEHHKLDLMAEVSHLKMRLASAEKDRRELDDRCRTVQRQVAELEAKLLMKDAENSELRLQLGRNGTLPIDSGDTEVEKLKRAVDNLMMTNEEKERKLEDLRRLLKRYRRVEEILVQAQARKAVEELLMNLEDGDTSSNSSSTTPSVGDTALRDQPHQHSDNSPDGRYYQSSPSSSNSPVHQINGGKAVSSIPADSRQAMGMTRSNSCENMDAGTQSKGPPLKKNEDHSTGGPGRAADGYAHTEVMTDDEDKTQNYSQGYGESKKLHGLRKLFGRLKRSSSQDFEAGRERGDDGEFRRGGVRATASARLAWNRDVKGLITNSDVPFARWDTDRVTAWMNDIGLNMYLVDCKRWVKNGEQLLRSSQHDLEKELNIKNSLHRKKLQLAIKAMTSEGIDRFMELDHNFVARWLDDIGLPQYKDSFYDARVDGRMLNNLTVEDLFQLKVSSEVHYISIKRGIQILRQNNFNPNFLRRRPAPEELQWQQQIKGIPEDVVLWTNHRVMEWLRTIDLSEYAPNLRGSGVHGAVMVLEPRFNSELFAVLLSIPPSKTLLRRHLNTHFISLIGPETQTKKREHESEPGYVPLLPNTKVKKGKFIIFSQRKVRTEVEPDCLVCPPELNGQSTNGKHDLATKEIGAFSHEINTLTNMLARDRFLDSAKTSNV